MNNIPKCVDCEKKQGFKQSLEYILSVLCYAYYVKHETIVNDHVFDNFERLYCKLFKVRWSPWRGKENEESYSYGTKFIFDMIMKANKGI